MLQSNILALAHWIFNANLPVINESADFTHFSLTHVSIGLYFIMLFLCMKRDLSIFIKISSYGALSIIFITLVIIGVGFYSLHNTHYNIIALPTKD